MQQSLRTRSGRVLVLPTREEDVAITAAALGDPDAMPLTDAQWEQLKQTPVPVFNMAERSYIGRLTSTQDAPVEVKVVFDHLFLTTNYRVAIGPYDLVKITHRFNREGRLDLIDARLKQTKRLYLDPSAPPPAEDTIFHLVQVFAFKDKQAELEWSESRCEYFIRLRQIAAIFYDLGLNHEEQQYRHVIQLGHRLMKELHRDERARTLRDVRVTRLPFYPFHQLADDEAATYIISRAALIEPRVNFDPAQKAATSATSASATSRRKPAR